MGFQIDTETIKIVVEHFQKVRSVSTIFSGVTSPWTLHTALQILSRSCPEPLYLQFLGNGKNLNPSADEYIMKI